MATESLVVQSILQHNQFLLRRHLVLSTTVLEELKKAGLISGIVSRKIQGSPDGRQVTTLLHHMEYKGLASLRKFLDVLRRTGHSWLADAMLDTDVNAAHRQRFTRDDIHFRDGFDHETPPPHHLPTIRGGLGNLGGRGFGPRQSITAGMPIIRGPPQEEELSLAALLKTRDPATDDLAPRGVIHVKDYLQENYSRVAAPYAARVGGLVPFPRTKDEIPVTLFGLNQAFSEQDQQHQHAMSVLKQEEIAIRQLMEQNARDQGHVHRKQAAVKDITRRLKDIYVRANDVYEPSPHPNIGRYRLHQLNQIPWSIAD